MLLLYKQDPKEYVPFLNELNKLELNYRRFKIDLHLGRHEKALRNISLCGKCFSPSMHYVNNAGTMYGPLKQNSIET